MIVCVLATLAHAMRVGRLAVRLRRAVWFVRAPVASSGARRRHAAHPRAPLGVGCGGGLVSVVPPAGWSRVAGRRPLATLGAHNPRHRLVHATQCSSLFLHSLRSFRATRWRYPCYSMQFALPALTPFVSGDTMRLRAYGYSLGAAWARADCSRGVIRR